MQPDPAPTPTRDAASPGGWGGWGGAATSPRMAEARAGWPGAREVRLAWELAGGWHVIVKSERGRQIGAMAPYRLAT